jgi:hypothetical protein
LVCQNLKMPTDFSFPTSVEFFQSRFVDSEREPIISH